MTLATIATQDTETRPTVAKVATVTVANPQESKNTLLSIADSQKLLAYLDAIGETDQASIDEYLTECGKDAETLARELQQAGDCLQIKTGDYTGLVQCTGCHHLAGDTCNRHGWRVVVDKWRRCSDHATAPATITCKSCGHFQSFNGHGGGAGACGAGVQPFGACWWADTVHECDKYQALEAGK
ncbi:hypothetical protein J0667_11820 [Methylomonas sp. WH-1]|uniref:hypothetical protein n=1 Tax=unclassified Methylomonas TaxID=2608980 RepID=UPI000B0E464D|nr:hypothetical protein [Methylomonas sp. LW13]